MRNVSHALLWAMIWTVLSLVGWAVGAPALFDAVSVVSATVWLAADWVDRRRREDIKNLLLIREWWMRKDGTR